MTQVYTSTVIAPMHLATATVVGAALAVLAAMSGPVWLAAAIGVVVLATGLHVSVVRCAVGPERIVAALGMWGRGRVIATSTIAEATTSDLRWPHVFGLGVRTTWRTTRLTVRPGPTLCLRLRDGEIMRISVNDPIAAHHILNHLDTDPEGIVMTNNSEHRSWFGPKRIGWGLRPQTWQGWTIVLAFAVIVTLIAVLAGH